MRKFFCDKCKKEVSDSNLFSSDGELERNKQIKINGSYLNLSLTLQLKSQGEDMYALCDNCISEFAHGFDVRPKESKEDETSI